MIKSIFPASILIAGILGFLIINTPVSYAIQPEAPQITPSALYPPPGIESDIKQAILDAIKNEAKRAPVYYLVETSIENVVVSSDESWATAWLVPIDPQTKEVIPTEPGLAVVIRQGSNWQVVLPGDPGWAAAISESPVEVLSEQEKVTWMEINTKAALIGPLIPFTGYYLPWESGKTLVLTQSVGHDRYTPSGSAHYAFDFATPYPSQMFNLLAAKSGTVKQAIDSCDNGSESCANWLVLEDTSTSPTTYQLYLHLAKNSIPIELHTIGHFVHQGEFIGIADDTGNSTGNHLHFMVHTNPVSYWGTSVDITFNEVTINGGRPRISSDLPYCRNDFPYNDVCNEVNNYYISANHLQGDQTQPYGDILDPLNGITVESNILHLEGWAQDDNSGLASAQFIAKYNDIWQDIGNPFSSLLFSMNWDLCSSGIPDGPVDLALEIHDNAGNYAAGLPGLRHFIKNYNCTPDPTICIPNSDQVALYREPDYKGTCQVFNTGNYSSTLSMSSIGDDQTSSIQVGNNVMANLFINNNYKGRGQTFINADSNLIDDLIGSDTTSAMTVRLRNTTPGTPILLWPTDNFSFHANPTVSLVGDNSGGATEFQAKISQPGGDIVTTSWQKYPIFPLGSLPSGNYSWQIKGRNNYSESNWSLSQNFSIPQSDPTLPNTITAPFTDDMENDSLYWLRSLYWDRTLENNHTPSGSISWKYDTNVKPEDGYDTGTPNSGDLTSVPIQIPISGNYLLHFWYYYETETRWQVWDQRWLQISVNGNPFENIYLFSEDPPNFWLQSPIIDLSSYAGDTIQIRFHFETLDKNFNKFKGWYLDDVSITNESPLSCDSTNEPNNFPTEAINIAYNTSISGVICPSGDVDYYTFQGVAGDHVGIVAYAQSTNPASRLDSYLTLFDTDETSPLVENDDMIPGVRTDSYIYYVLPRTDTYYFSIHAWDHPSVGGYDYLYSVSLFNDNIDPSADFLYPTSGIILSGNIITIALSAQDNLTGISHIQFFSHTSDWKTENWQLVGEDWDGSDGWSIAFDLTSVGYQPDMAFYARVFDNAGNQRDVGSWNLINSAIIRYFPLIAR
jgi:hypothetical protein